VGQRVRAYKSKGGEGKGKECWLPGKVGEVVLLNALNEIVGSSKSTKTEKKVARTGAQGVTVSYHYGTGGGQKRMLPRRHKFRCTKGRRGKWTEG